jgi:undecaprenyl phosphate-alpha-L-ara4N flippase subunit ArnF
MQLESPARPRHWWLNPYLHLVLNGVLVSVSELLLKAGAVATAGRASPTGLGWTGITSLTSGWVIAGILCYLVSFVNWLQALRAIPLSIAYPVTSGAHVLIPIGSWIFLGEHVGLLRWAGILLIMTGITFCARAENRP